MTEHCKLTLRSQVVTKKTASHLLPKVPSGRKSTAIAFCLCTALAAVIIVGNWNTRVFTLYSEESTSSVRSVPPSPVLSTFKPCRCAENPKVPKEMLVFIHIPKTGGENLENILGIRKDHTYGDDPRRPSRTCPPSLTLNNTAVVQSQLSVQCDFTSNVLYFTIVRNPFDRLWSWFRFCLHGWRGLMPTPDGAKCSFIHALFEERWGIRFADELMKQNSDVIRVTVSEIFTRWLKETAQVGHSGDYGENDAGYIWASYLRWITDRDTGKILTDFIVRFEDDDAMLGCAGATRSALLCFLGRQPSEKQVLFRDNNSTDGQLLRGVSAPFLHTLAAKRYNYWFSAEARQMVEMAYAKDLKLFDYRF